MYKIEQVISYNMDILLSLNYAEYPELCKPRRKKVLHRLFMLMEYMLTYDKPAWTNNGKEYYLFSLGHLSDWYRANGGSGDKTSWESLKIFFLHTGLIDTYVVIGEQDNPFLQKNWEIAKAKGHKTETLWTVPLYTPSVLQHAEEIARQYTERHVNISHIRKNDIARAWDRQTAERLYRSTAHDISAAERQVYGCLVKAMKDLIAKQGYTVETAMIAEGKRLCEITTSLEPDEYSIIIQKLMRQKRNLITYNGCEYHPQRKQDRVLSIPDAYTGYIITRK